MSMAPSWWKQECETFYTLNPFRLLKQEVLVIFLQNRGFLSETCAALLSPPNWWSGVYSILRKAQPKGSVYSCVPFSLFTQFCAV